MSAMDDPWVDADTASRFTGMPKRSLEDYCRRGLMPKEAYGRIGKHYRFKLGVLDKVIRNQQIGSSSH